MIGKLTRLKDTWYVMRVEEGDWNTYYPINSTQMNSMKENFNSDYLESLDGKEVEFELYKSEDDSIHYALISTINNNSFFKMICIQLSKRLSSLPYDQGDLSDIGNEIGIVVAEYIGMLGNEKDLIDGIKHGIKLKNE